MLRTKVLPAPRWAQTGNFKQHTPFLTVLLLHLVLAVIFSCLIPLGEAPDELAHLNYARFIAQNGRLPTTLAERQAAGYRSTWPPLYHFLVAGPLITVGDESPTHLKSVGDTPRRLIPTNGQTIASLIHTADETWPWRGITLAWHLGRFVSVVLTALSVILTYLIAWRLTKQRRIATSAAALYAFIPQVLFIGGVINDDNLLILLSGLILLMLTIYTQQASVPGISQLFLLGALLGLATITKYNALPLWIFVLTWAGWRIFRSPLSWANVSSAGRFFTVSLTRLIALLIGAAFASSWWFIFIWRNFNQVDNLGLLAGSLAALTAGTADASLRQLTSGSSITIPPATAWLEWFSSLFKSFWGLFGGGGTIEFPGWVYWLLAIICFLAIGLYIVHRVSRITLLLLFPLLSLPLPLLRFILTGGNIIETAQGRHLFPALPVITLALIWGLSRITQGKVERMHHILRLEIILPTFTLFLSFYTLFLIQSSYPPPIPLHTTADAATAQNLLTAKLAEGVTLIGYEVGQTDEGILPLTLVWQADAIPPEDYLIELTLIDASGQLLGGWLGHPLGGRYPTRAWDKGDILRDTIPIPLLPGASTTPATLTLNLLDTSDQPVTTPLTLVTDFSLSPSPVSAATSTVALPSSSAPVSVAALPAQLRADGLPSEAPFTYRSTLSFILPDTTSPPDLIAPSGQVFPTTRFLPGPNGSIAHFIVAANWPSGDYQLNTSSSLLPTSFLLLVQNRPRQFEPPPMDYTLNANFADHITLLGYDLPQRRVQPGESFPVTLHLRAEHTLGQDLVIFNHLLDQDVVQWGGADRIPLKYYTTLLWVPGEIVSDAYEVYVEPTSPSGVYWLDVGLYPSGRPNFSLPLFVDGQPIDQNSVRLSPIKVGGPPPGITVPDVQPQHPLNKNFGDQITLLGFNLTDVDKNPLEDVIRNTQHVTLTLFWQADTIPSADNTVFVHILDSEGNLAAQFDNPPAAGAYPTSLWDPGEIIADERLLSDFSPGLYTLQVGLYQPDTGERLPVEGSVDGVVRLMDFEVE